ncbi:hypothetical protein [Fusobacterium varium]|uniref:hypothetical protein n=1 Tax=Fusobacterium varium TaxID=856 RepID=UPI0029208717|nr:hypothetical protein AUSP0054_00045 [uncultured phage]
MTRDELRKVYTFLKKETGADGVPSRSLGSKEECLEKIREILYRDKKLIDIKNEIMRALKEENKYLWERIKTGKKWWQIWK